jgi:hypothetical protein
MAARRQPCFRWRCWVGHGASSGAERTIRFCTTGFDEG